MGLTEAEPYDDPADPLRPVDRRWRRAVYLVENGRRVSPRRDDAWARAAARFCRALRRCRDDAARQGLARRLPGLSQAHALYAGPPSLARWHLEARLLTREPFGQVAAKCATTPEVAEAYEAVFFCVRDRLHVEGYVLHVAIGRKQYAGLSEADVGVLLKRHAFGGGPAALDAVLDCIQGPPKVPERPEQLGPAGQQALRDRLLVRAWIALDTLPTDGKAMKRLAILSDAADVFRRGRGPGDDADGLNTPLATGPSCREWLFNAPGRAAGAAGERTGGVSGGNQVGRPAAAGAAPGGAMLAPAPEEENGLGPSPGG
jgi:hypothetical protein